MRSSRGFSLIELLVVIAIITILAGLLFPVFAQAKAEAKKIQCISNLKQVGTSIALYMGDSDDLFPVALDASDRWAPEIWENEPEFADRIPYMPMLHDVLQPYIKSQDVFHCPMDNGTYVLDNHFPSSFRAAPSLYRTYGSSYFFRTEISFRAFSSTQFQLPANVNVLFDAAGHWHANTRGLKEGDNVLTYLQLKNKFRYNTLFGDFHAKNLTNEQLEKAWATDL